MTPLPPLQHCYDYIVSCVPTYLPSTLILTRMTMNHEHATLKTRGSRREGEREQKKKSYRVLNSKAELPVSKEKCKSYIIIDIGIFFFILYKLNQCYIIPCSSLDMDSLQERRSSLSHPSKSSLCPQGIRDTRRDLHCLLLYFGCNS